MKKLINEDISQEVFDLYNDYAHNKIDRKRFVEKLSLFAVGALTVMSLLNFTPPKLLNKKLITLGNSCLKSEFITYESPKEENKIKTLLSQPTGTKKKLPRIIVVHENRGLNPYIEDVGRRAAVDGFITMTPYALSPLAGYPGNQDDGRVLQEKQSREEVVEDFIAAYDYLKSHTDCNDQVGTVGFCFGGWIANTMAVKIQTLPVALPYYGGKPTGEEAAQITTSLLLLQLAGLDSRLNKDWTSYEAIIKKKKVENTAYTYPGVNHGFHNKKNPRYDEAAATLS